MSFSPAAYNYRHDNVSASSWACTRPLPNFQPRSEAEPTGILFGCAAPYRIGCCDFAMITSVRLRQPYGRIPANGIGQSQMPVVET